jgi:hypothetical protein
LGEGAIGLLLDIKEVVQGAARAGQVPVDEERRYDFVQVAGPHRVVGAGGINQAGSPRPRHRRGGDEPTPEGLVLTGGEHHRRNGVRHNQNASVGPFQWLRNR